MSELGKRVAVAAVGIPAVLAIAWVGGWLLGALLGSFAAWAAHECFRFAHRKEIEPIAWIGVPMAPAFVLLAVWRPSFREFAPWALGLVAVATLGALLAAMIQRGPGRNPFAAAAITVMAPMYVGLTLAFAPLLHALGGDGWGDEGVSRGLAGLIFLALPLAATWIGDAAAFFAGSAWGRNRAKLAPAISPNKSWIGFWAGLSGGGLAGVLWFVVATTFLGATANGTGYAAAALMGVVLGLVAVLGDLVESLLKREAGVKDSGTFFPGHGGVMDRIDSLIFTIPTAFALLILLGSVL
jgi:phosphatidate cytidylyltransferase